jgi:CRISPR-associated protein Cas5t
MDPVALYVSVPVASFRVPHAREYFETLAYPPPSTVYGMLLALVGEEDRLRHAGAELAVALLSIPERSVVLRRLWRVKSKKAGPGSGKNKRPDFQELLTGVRLAVWVRAGAREERVPRLVDRVRGTLAHPNHTQRFGALSLGESTHLVDEVRSLGKNDGPACHLLLRDSQGDIVLPVWPDHVGSAGTRWERYRLENTSTGADPPAAAWTPILKGEGTSRGVSLTG